MSEEFVVGGDKPKRKVRKASPKPRGRSPAPGDGEGSPPSSGKKSRKKPHVPANPKRGGGSSPPSTAEDKSHAKKERSGRMLSPKRDNLGGFDENTNVSNTSSKSLNAKKDKPQSQRARSPKRGDAKDSHSTRRIVSPKRNGSRGRSPDSSRRLMKNNSDKSDRSMSPSRRGEKGESSTRNGKQRPVSPKREDGQRACSPKRSGKKPGLSKKSSSKSKSKNSSSNPGQSSSAPQEPSMELAAETDDEETESEYSGGSPQYVSPKGNTTHLQLDMSKMGGADIPVFSLLDDNSVLDVSTDEEGSRSKSPYRYRTRGGVDANHRDSLLDTVNSRKREQQERASAVPPTTELQFTPWGFTDKDDGKVKKSGVTGMGMSIGSGSPKGNMSPLGIKRAVKAFKYTKPSMSGASDLMGKLNKGFQQRLGLSPQHEQMKDEDDLASLL